jgi:hypothetical protein
MNDRHISDFRILFLDFTFDDDLTGLSHLQKKTGFMEIKMSFEILF